MMYWLAWEEPRAVGDLVHVEKFFARNLGGLIHARTRMPGRLGRRQAVRRACTWMRSRMRPEHLRATEQGEATPDGGRGGKGLTQGEQR